MHNSTLLRFTFLKTCLFIFFLFSISFSASAEGSKNLTPANTGVANGVNQFIGYLQHDDGGNSGAFLKPGAAANFRLYIRVKAGEILYYGVRRRATNSGGDQGDLTLTLRDNAGNIVQNTTLNRDAGSFRESTLNAQAGVIGTYAQAAAGPSAAVGVAGYDALSYTNTTGTDQDFYIEFTQPAGVQQKSWYDLWDFSVYDGTTEKTGRLYAQAWSFSAGAGDALLSTDFKMFGLIPPTPTTTDEFYVKQVDLAGIRPFGALIYMNAEGTTNGADFRQRRQSKTANSAYPEYKIFVNNPDIDEYPTSILPQVSILNHNAYCNIGAGASAVITYETSQIGYTTLVIDLNGIAGYQPGTADVIIEEQINTPGRKTVVWNGLDGNGVAVASGTTIQLSTAYVSGALHIPLWDVEGNSVGVNITDIRPNTTADRIYWDDTNLPAADFDPQTVLDGTNVLLHDWPNGNSGDGRLVNTWSYGFFKSNLEVTPFTYICDFDNDGIDDRTDLDDDNDGILDTDESPTDYYADADGDNIPNYLDVDFPGYVDSNNDGINDNFDTDKDGIVDARDLDSDNDGLPDVLEAGGTDADGNGIIDGFTDANNDGHDDATAATPLANPDTDGDGIRNIDDIDSDNDGILDTIEAGGNVDATGKIIGFADANNNGLSDNIEATRLPNPDAEGDGRKNYLDIDADNDGITDNFEGQSSSAYIPPTNTDTDGDGLDDAYDPDNGGSILFPVNTESTGQPDYLDTDSDDDGVIDLIEGHDGNSDGQPDWDTNNNYTSNNPTAINPFLPSFTEETGATATADADNDGLLDIFDTINGFSLTNNAVGSRASRQNTDNADNPDWRDTDDDNDGILTNAEGGGDGNWSNDFTQGGNTTPDYLFRGDSDGDGVVDITDLDSDNDGILDTDEDGGTGIDPSQDADTDGIPNYKDANLTGFVDTNSDGVDDRFDNDLDGIPDFLDLDSDNDGILDAIEANGGGIPTGFDVNTGRFTIADDDNDGLMNSVDNTPAATGGTSNLPNPNTDGDLRNDFLDIDADNDGIVDNRESQSSAGYIAQVEMIQMATV